MQQQIIEIVAIVFEIDSAELSPESSLATVEQWNSMNHMKLILTLEEEFSIAITDDEAIELLSISDICQFIQDKTA